MARRKAVIETAQVAPQVAPATQEATIMINGVAMTATQIMALAAQNAALQNAATTKAPTDPTKWYGGFKLFGKGTLTAPYQGQPGKPSEKGYLKAFSVPGVHPDSLKALPKNPSGVLALAMVLCDAAEAIVDNLDQFVLDAKILENWQDVLARFGPETE